MGEVFKLKDLRLDRIVAAKVVRAESAARWTSGMEGFLREARALALFSDRRIVQVFEFRPDATRPSSSWSSWTASSSGASGRRSSSRSGRGS